MSTFELAYTVYPHDFALTPLSSFSPAPSPTYSPTPADDPTEIDYSPTTPTREPTEEELQQMLGPTWSLVPTPSQEYGTFLPPTPSAPRKRKAEGEHPEQPPAKRQQ